MFRVLMAAAMVFFVSASYGATYTFLGTNNTNWGLNSNWFGSTAPPRAGAAGANFYDIVLNSGDEIIINAECRFNNGGVFLPYDTVTITMNSGSSFTINDDLNPNANIIDFRVSGGTLSVNSGSTSAPNFLSITGEGDVSISSNASLSFSDNANFTIDGTLDNAGTFTSGGTIILGTANDQLTNQSTGTLNANGGISISNGTISNSNTLNIGGNLTISGGTFTSTASTAEVVFNGSSAQSASGFTSYAVEVNNANGINLNGNMNISSSGSLTFTAGDINTSSNKVVLGASATITGETSDRYVVGELEATESVTTSATYDFGGAGITVAVTGGSTNAGTVTMNRFTGTAVAGNSNSGLQRYVSLDGTSTSFTTAEVVISYYDTELGSISPESDLQGFRTAASNNETDGTASWSGVTENVNTTNNTITISGLSPAQFDAFSFSGGDKDQVLPIVLANFEVSLENDLINLDWTTAIEENNEGFELQRSYDGITFEPAGWVDGNGNSLSPIDYSFIDREANIVKSKTIYYRIRQVDFDGVFNYTPTRSINLDGSSTITWFPNPAQENIVVNTNETAIVEVYDMAGKTVLTTNTLESNSIDVSRIEMGTYLMIIKNMNGEVISQDKLHIK